MSEFTDLITISQMTPGPIAVNSATFVGLKVAGLGGHNPGGHNLRSDYSGNPQIAELVTDRGAGGNPRTLNINETH